MKILDQSTPVRDKVLEGLKSAPTRMQLEVVLAEALATALGGAPAGSPEAAEAFATVTLGAMRAYILIGRDMTESSVKLLGMMANVAGKVKMDPQFAMKSSLPGLAHATLAGPPGVANNMRSALDEAFLGVGQAFAETCRHLPRNSLS